MSHLYLIAQIAGRAVAIDSEQVESVVDIGEVTAVPRASAHVRGLAALRSRVVTVVDTQSALGMAGGSPARRAVITHVEGHHYAMLVDALDDVAPFELLPLAHGVTLDPAWRGAGRGIVERDGEPILAIDLASLVPGHAGPN
ncbi:MULTISPECIES: chemotaxis protein CheW [Sphingomonas]|uniref:chemotaxis protein CheW n=1 Tax=Sphingomonas TaxID=13687 RepID=UPI00095A06B7|nr:MULTISPECIES: chemotaxis protein CheW [unclassified Sphingomonas]MDF2385433.1 chemotaxis protein CheW [Nostoc ellipsosporum NOK]MBN8811529.1 chemotaxis protein CheW [Sphingomonas sp.]MBQ1499870.1 chemotaxis protein CheW [Sphingomonas sp.]MDH4743336.1 chemotaxis protein CheW [Sphingomonas sp. CBMAI 2297]OJY49784.1 MAG: chemotaxis protein CheW [Sphingomonas sp. 67-41]